MAGLVQEALSLLNVSARLLLLVLQCAFIVSRSVNTCRPNDRTLIVVLRSCPSGNQGLSLVN